MRQLESLRSLQFTLQEGLGLTDEQNRVFDTIVTRHLTELDTLERLERERSDERRRSGLPESGQPEDPALGPDGTIDVSQLDDLQAVRELRRMARARGDQERYRELSTRLRDLNRPTPDELLARERMLADLRSQFATDEQRAEFDRVVRELNDADRTRAIDRASRYSSLLSQMADTHPEQRAALQGLSETYDQELRGARGDPELARAVVEQYREDILAELNESQQREFFKAEQATMPASRSGAGARTFAALRDVELRDPQQVTFRQIREQYLQELRQLDSNDPRKRQEVYDRLRQDVLAALDEQQAAGFLEAERRLLPDRAEPLDRSTTSPSP